MRIRGEAPGDAAEIRRVHEAAFGRRDEADLVDALRAAGAITCALVATGDHGEILGHVVFSPIAIDTPARRFSQLGVGLAPLAVLPAHQRAGIGGALVEAGLARLRGTVDAVVVLGHPAYYPRFGFRDARAFGLAWEVAGHEEAFMALELSPGALRDRAGIVRYRPEVMGLRLRPARADELARVQAIEVAAAARFRTSAHASAADGPPLPTERLAALCAVDGLWVVEATDGTLAAFVAVEVHERDLYIVELDVDPAHAGGRLGAALLDHAALLARRRGLARLVLRTFADVPWNAPYYRRLGFTDLDAAPASFAAIIAHEAEAGLDLARRVTLARDVTTRRP